MDGENTRLVKKLAWYKDGEFVELDFAEQGMSEEEAASMLSGNGKTASRGGPKVKIVTSGRRAGNDQVHKTAVEK